MYDQIVRLPDDAKQRVDPDLIRKAEQRMTELQRTADHYSPWTNDFQS